MFLHRESKSQSTKIQITQGTFPELQPLLVETGWFEERESTDSEIIEIREKELQRESKPHSEYILKLLEDIKEEKKKNKTKVRN